MMPIAPSHLRILAPAPGVLAFYDGRIPGLRAAGPAPNWLDDGAYTLGVCTYAIVSEGEALVYDTHISVDHARAIRATLAAMGVERVRVVLSHWHRDHVAGNAVFADGEILSHRLTLQALEANRTRIEGGDPAINPLVLPNRTYDGPGLSLRVGPTRVHLVHADVHSRDGTLMLLPEQGLLLAGDAVEDPLTYVAEPERLAAHLVDLRRLAERPLRAILPNHGDPDVIASGGYPPALVGATIRYVEQLLRCRTEPDLAEAPVEAWLGDDIAAGTLRWFEPYRTVHRGNVERVLATSS